MALPFPAPPAEVVEELDRAARLSRVEAPERTESLELGLLQRPWDPPSCRPELRVLIYRWLDDVVGWLNEEYVWRTHRVVPPCWPEHPHIVHELAVVAVLRREAGDALSPAPLEEWHRFTLPQFLERIAARVGETGCPPERHQERPGVARDLAYATPAAVLRRQNRIKQDSAAQAPLDAPQAGSA
jgi:hypothetical protein